MRILPIVLLLIFCVCTIYAQPNIEWTGDGDGISWEDPDNWTLDRVPIATDSTRIDMDSVVISSDAMSARLRLRFTAILTILEDASLMLNEADVSIADVYRMRNSSKLYNHGLFTIMGSNGNPFRGDMMAQAFNSGTLDITNGMQDGIEMNTQFSFINQSGAFLRVRSIDSDGIDLNNMTSFVNEAGATVVINDLGQDEEGINIDDGSSFENRGTLRISNIDDADAICIDDNNAVFDNYGSIFISDVTARGEGIEVDDGVFTNHPDGKIFMKRVSGDGLYIQSGGEVFNEGLIEILMFEPGAESDNAVELESSSFLENSGTLRISNPGSTDAIEIESSAGEMINQECGVIEILTASQIEIQGAGGNFNNFGVISTAFSGTNTNNGTITNEAGAFIFTPTGMFDAAPNALTDNGGQVEESCMAPTTEVASICEGGPCVVPIPTMGQWGLIILSALMMIFSVVWIKQKKLIKVS